MNEKQEHQAHEARGRQQISEDTSDGYHTFKELYEFRKVYNAALFNAWHQMGLYSPIKSKRHDDGEECFGGGWFIVQAELPTGQISNHYELKDWNLFQIPEREVGYNFDGHTAQDVLERLQALTDEDPNLQAQTENHFRDVRCNICGCPLSKHPKGTCGR